MIQVSTACSISTAFSPKSAAAHWVKIDARRVPVDAIRPQGVAYSLTLHEPGGQRVYGIDNAHIVRVTRGPAGRSSASRDHLHRGETVRPYVYRDADALIDDFWREVEAIVTKAGNV